MTHLPIILIDLCTEKSVVGRRYLKPYLPKAIKYLIPALLDFGEMLKGRRVAGRPAALDGSGWSGGQERFWLQKTEGQSRPSEYQSAGHAI